MPFNEDGSVDEDGLRNYIVVSIEGGSRSIILTGGDSHYDCLSQVEIADVTKIICEHTAGRAIVVVADGRYATTQAIEFAEYACGLGAVIYMLLPPTGFAGCTPESFANHYVTVAKVMPVMVVTCVFEEFDDIFALETLRIIFEKTEGVMAIKDDRGSPFVQKMCLQCHEHCAVFAGGQKLSHLAMHPFGCDGYMSMAGTFKPELAQRYWKSITDQDFITARQIVANNVRMWDYLMKVPNGGWNTAAHGMLELCGIAKR